MQRIFIHNETLKRKYKCIAIVTLLAPVVGTIMAICWAATRGINAVTAVTTVCMYLATTLGLTVGFHRFFTHKSFKAFGVTKSLLAILGMMAAQGPLLFWVASHRRHHAFSDTTNDCHSPCLHGSGALGTIRGLWHAQFGWMIGGEITNVSMFAKDILRDKLLVTLNRFYLIWVGVGLLIPAVIGIIASGDWHGAMEGLLWGGFFRICFVHQITWGLNSLNHVFGFRRYQSNDNSRNIGWLALITMGEGWHNNHHAHPGSAKFGHKWWEIDLGFGFIRAMQICRLCTEVQMPNTDVLAKKKVNV